MITHTVSCSPYRILYFPSLARDWLGSVSSEFTVKQDSEFLIVHPGFRYWILTITVLRVTYSLSVSYLVTALALAPRL